VNREPNVVLEIINKNKFAKEELFPRYQGKLYNVRAK
jgi:hypothetical protein